MKESPNKEEKEGSCQGARNPLN